MPAPAAELIPTRQSLLTRLKDWEDQESWREFFDTYWRLVYGLALKCGLTDAEAQDVVQETMISVARQMPRFKYDPAVGKFKGWLLQITRRRITDQLRKRDKAARQPTVATAEGGVDASSGPETADPVERIADASSADHEDTWESEWKRNLLEAALARVQRRVSAKQFQMFDLYVTQQWPMALVTSTLGVNAAQVYMAKMRVGLLVKKEVQRLEEVGM